MKKILKNPYIILTSIITFIFIFLFVSKGIFPFGENSLIWGDMYDQITAFYYHFYDSFHGNKSLMINFTTSGGVNFFGILSYYLISPLSALILFFPRENIYQVLSIIIAMKILLSGITALYSFKYFFKNTSNYIHILLALLYAFSGYNLIMYQITSWMDIVYLFPLLMIGIKKIFDLEKSHLYIIILTISFICSFYLSTIMLLFIFIISYIYLLIFKEKEYIKKVVVKVGFSTLFAILLSSVIVIPTYMQLGLSSRMGFNLNSLLNSQFGALGDKLIFFITSGFSIVILLNLFKYLLKNKNAENNKILKFVIIITIIFTLPIIIEPINKLLHLGSYALFPLRYYFIGIYLLLLSNLYYFDKCKEKQISNDVFKNLLPIIIGIIITLVTLYLSYTFLQENIFGISFGKEIFPSAILLGLISIIIIISYFLFNNNHLIINKKIIILSYIIVLVNVLTMSYLYFGLEFASVTLNNNYKEMNFIYNNYKDDNNYRIKSNLDNFVMNNGMITNFHNIDHFTSLTEGNVLLTLKKLGYSSYWMKTTSKGGTLFTDRLLANKYLLTEYPEKDDDYQFKAIFNDTFYYQYKFPGSYGYFIKENTSIMKELTSFDSQNKIYEAITKDKYLFEKVNNEWNKVNTIETTKKTKTEILNRVEIDDKNKIAYFEQTFKVIGEKQVYLELLRSLSNDSNKEMMYNTNIYLNDKLLIDEYPKEVNNGLLNLGTFSDEEVKIRIEFIRPVNIKTLAIGMMDLNKYKQFVTNYKNDLKVDFNKNEINITVTSDKDQILYIPINHSEGYKGYNNDKETNVLKVFDNFIGINVTEGQNNIKLTYYSPGLKLGALVSLFVLILCIVMYTTKLHLKLENNKLIKELAYKAYNGLFIILIPALFILPIVFFILSFLFKIRLY